MAITGTTDLGDGRYFLSINHDPASTATDAPQYSMAHDANGIVWQKRDDGNTTNWVKLKLVDKLDATTNPGSNDDITQGYDVNSKWLNTTTPSYWVCTDNSVGSANWLQLG